MVMPRDESHDEAMDRRFAGFIAWLLCLLAFGAIIALAAPASASRVSEAAKQRVQAVAPRVFRAEGARGSLSKIAIRKYGLDTGREPQKYGIGLKEIWQVKPENHQQESTSLSLQ